MRKCIPQQQFKGETSVVDIKSPNVQWALPSSAWKYLTMRTDERLGCSLSRNSNKRGMLFTGTITSYKCIENEGSKTSIGNILQAVSYESYSFPNMQNNSLLLFFENGRKQKQVFIRISKRNLKYLLHHGTRITAKYRPSFMNGNNWNENVTFNVVIKRYHLYYFFGIVFGHPQQFNTIKKPLDSVLQIFEHAGKNLDALFYRLQRTTATCMHFLIC